MRYLLNCLLGLSLAIPVFANPIPSLSNPSGTDRIRTSGGSSCEQAIATGKTFQVGTYGSSGNEDSDNYYNNYYHQNQDEAGIYAAVTFQFGGEDRVDCTRLYELELRDRTREEELAQAEHELKLLQIEAEKYRLLKMKQTNTTFSE
ncbi:hypothetical protein [Aliivibrio sifiae]|uniref:DNA repair protein n=1 Tax=Aliivibrio sifiae TaxID=566293 RepID=A0A2S7X5U6_9GAMM|nr:hypothetical protein [Aliivibrio sifiae]PQJ86744.1 hypothetical protein BTO23_11395 [Aliivibrio sifiae]GLR74151.1 hypothetical protein GCM10007855_10250 [Aliivibrio sifiae]